MNTQSNSWLLINKSKMNNNNKLLSKIVLQKKGENIKSFKKNQINLLIRMIKKEIEWILVEEEVAEAPEVQEVIKEVVGKKEEEDIEGVEETKEVEEEASKTFIKNNMTKSIVEVD